MVPAAIANIEAGKIPVRQTIVRRIRNVTWPYQPSFATRLTRSVISLAIQCDVPIDTSNDNTMTPAATMANHRFAFPRTFSDMSCFCWSQRSKALFRRIPENRRRNDPQSGQPELQAGLQNSETVSHAAPKVD